MWFSKKENKPKPQPPAPKFKEGDIVHHVLKPNERMVVIGKACEQDLYSPGFPRYETRNFLCRAIGSDGKFVTAVFTPGELEAVPEAKK